MLSVLQSNGYTRCIRELYANNWIDRKGRKDKYGLSDPPALAVFVIVFFARNLYLLLKYRKKEILCRTR